VLRPCAQNNNPSRVHKLATVVFADAEEIEANLVGKHNLF
jgi:hypothetical protein